MNTDPQASVDAIPVTHATHHQCRRCQQLFWYRYDGFYREGDLKAIDFICRACLPAWFYHWEARHDWA